MIIKNAKVYSDGCRFVEKDLIIRDGRIVFGAAPQEGEDVIDAGGAYALPGLVDIHFHGAVGHDFCDADEAGLQAIADFEASKGVLAICPATMTFSEEILNGIMDVAAAHKNERGADLVGINMEGPYISPKKVGAQNPKYVMAADAGMFRRLQARSGGLIKLVDVAPEEPGNMDFIKECHDEVRISIAHTCTNYDTANALFYGNVDLGADLDASMDAIRYMHLKDKGGERTVWDFPALGKGWLDFPLVFDKLAKAGNDCPFSIEIEFTQAGAKDLAEINQAVKDSAEYLTAHGFVL